MASFKFLFISNQLTTRQAR